MHTSGALVFAGAVQGAPSECLALVAREAYTCRSHRAVTNRKQLGYPIREQQRGSREKRTIFPCTIFPWKTTIRLSSQIEMPVSQSSLKEVYLQTLKAATEGSCFQEALHREGLRSSPLEHWQVLAQSELLRATKNKVGCLDNHNGLRDSQNQGQGWTKRFIYTRPLLQDWERWLFYLMNGNQHRESRMMKKQNCIPNEKR